MSADAPPSDTPPADVDTDTEPPKNDQDPSPNADTAGGTDWEAKARKAEADAAKWRELARKHEGRAKANADAATKAQTVEQQVEELRRTLAERDVRDVERAGRLAVSHVQARLAANGLSAEDMAGVLDLIDPVVLLVDGEPDDKAIKKLSDSLTKVAGRTTPDRDQGQRGGNGPLDMNALIRRRAGVGH